MKHYRSPEEIASAKAHLAEARAVIAATADRAPTEPDEPRAVTTNPRRERTLAARVQAAVERRR